VFYVGIRLMEPGASIHQNNKLKVILFVLPWFLLIIWLFCDLPYGVLCFKTSFECRRLLLCYIYIWKKILFYTFSFHTAKLFLLINFIQLNLIHVINNRHISC
jgi:hypothetical protein